MVKKRQKEGGRNKRRMKKRNGKDGSRKQRANRSKRLKKRAKAQRKRKAGRRRKTRGKVTKGKGRSGKRRQRTGCSRQASNTSDACLALMVTAFKFMKGQVKNFKQQYNRIRTFHNQILGKGGKKGNFANATADMLAGLGGNESNLVCGTSRLARWSGIPHAICFYGQIFRPSPPHL